LYGDCGYFLDCHVDSLVLIIEALLKNPPSGAALEVGRGGVLRLLDDFFNFNKITVVGKYHRSVVPHANYSTKLSYNFIESNGPYSFVVLNLQEPTTINKLFPFLANKGLFLLYGDNILPAIEELAKNNQPVKLLQVADNAGSGSFCIGIKLGNGPKDVSKKPLLPVMNLWYHIAGIESFMLNFNLLELPKYVDIFDGELFVTLASGKNLLPKDWLRRSIQDSFYLAGVDTQRLVIEDVDNNDSRETVHFFDKMLPRLQSDGGYTFFCHSKGVSREACPHVSLWTDWLYQFSLANPKVVHSILEGNCFAGTLLTQSYDRTVDSDHTIEIARTIGGNTVPWEYSGTFFWMNDDRLMERNFNTKYRGRWSVEAWPGQVAPFDCAGSLFRPHTFRGHYEDEDYKYMGGAEMLKKYYELLKGEYV
jgi:hypothetical protein